MKIFNKNNKGFTLIELLVVIAIIGLLSSVVLASLNSARDKAKDAAVKQEVRELAKLFELEYSDNGSYANLNANACTWITYGGSSNCNSFFLGAYAVQARNICNNIVNNAKTGPYSLLICNEVSSTQRYSINVALNNGYLFCSGSSGTSDRASLWTSVGCQVNP